MIRRAIGVLVAAGLFWVCQSVCLAAEEQKVTAGEIKEQVEKTVKATGDFAAQKRDEYQKLMEAKISEWSARIGDLEAAAKKAKAGTQEEAKKKIEDLKQKKAELEQKLGELKQSSAGAWNDVKAGLEKASEAVKKAYEQALSNFK